MNWENSLDRFQFDYDLSIDDHVDFVSAIEAEAFI